MCVYIYIACIYLYTYSFPRRNVSYKMASITYIKFQTNVLKFNTVSSLQKPMHIIYIDQKDKESHLYQGQRKQLNKETNKFCKTAFWK